MWGSPGKQNLFGISTHLIELLTFVEKAVYEPLKFKQLKNLRI